MTRRTIRIGIDHMIEVELHSYGWEIAALGKQGNSLTLYIEPDVEQRDRRIVELAGKLALQEFQR